MKYFLGLSSTYHFADTLRHTFATGDEYNLSELRAFLAAHYGATFDHVAIYQNGRTALNVAIKAVTKRGGKVVITSLTCYAVVQAVKAAGCVPIFADVDPKTLHFGKPELEKAIEGEKDVQAVIVQNNLGIPADIAGIEEVAKAHKLVIIEDLAHCAGVRYADGREAGTVGRVAALSFGKAKSIDTITGGAVVFSDPLDSPVKQPEKAPLFKDNFRARIYPLLSLIIRACYNIHPKVGKYLTSTLVRIHAIKRSADGDVDSDTRLSFWQCKLALRQLKAMPHRGRGPLRDFYLVDNRDALLDRMEKSGFFFREIWYDIPVAPERYFRKADYHPAECPVATKIATQIVNLPTYYDAADLKPALKMIRLTLADKTENTSEDEANEPLTEAEKKAKIRAEKVERKKAKRAAKKTAKKSANKSDKAKPEVSTEPEVATKSEAAAAESERLLQTRAASEASTEPSTGGDVQAQARLDASDAARREAKQRSETAADASDSATSAPEPEYKGNAVMRQAPRKLSDREKLKLELESGKKEGPSVI